MRYILYYIAVFFVVIWAIAFFGYHVGALVHLLLVIALISVLLKVIKGEPPV